MARKLSIFIFVTVILASVLFAHAQQPTKIRIGYLSGGNSTSDNSALNEAFRQGLRTAWRKHHWILHPCPGDKRKTNGASEGDSS
jgi:ABC-type multidrug transport system permease subunit